MNAEYKETEYKSFMTMCNTSISYTYSDYFGIIPQLLDKGGTLLPLNAISGLEEPNISSFFLSF